MAEFVPGKTTRRRRAAALQAALFTNRQKSAVVAQNVAVNTVSSTQIYLKYPVPASAVAGQSGYTLGNPTDGQTLTLNGTVITFVATFYDPPGKPRFANMVLIGANLPATLANLLTVLQANTGIIATNGGTKTGTTDTQVAKCTYAVGNQQTKSGKTSISSIHNMLTITVPVNTPFIILSSARGASAPTVESVP